MLFLAMQIKGSVVKFYRLSFLSLLALTWATTVIAQTQDLLSARALLIAAERATLSGELTANVVELPFRMGATFTKGDALVNFDCALYEAQAVKVGAEVAVAKAKVENAEQLNKLGSIGTFDLAQARGELASAQADLELALINTKRCTIHAPFDGAVVELFIKEHEKAEQQPLIEIVGSKGFQAEVIVPASWSLWLEPGLVFELVTDDTETRVGARIAQINPTVDTVSQTLKLIADLDGTDGVLAGMSATALFMPPSN